MDKYFAEWYAAAAVEINDDRLRKRWAGIEIFLQAAKGEDLFDLLRVFRGRAPATPDFVERFRKGFFDADATFRPRGNELEVRVLAGSSLAVALQSEDTAERTALSLAIVCSECKGLATPLPVPAAAERAQSYLIQRATELRAASLSKKVSLGALPTKEQIDKISERAQANDPNGVAQNTKGAIELIAQAVRPVAGALNSLSAAYNSLLEETNILWWLFGEYSNEERKLFSQVAPNAAPLLAAKELAQLTINAPGPISAEAILARMLRNIKKAPKSISLLTAISDLSNSIREKWTDSNRPSDALDFCPISFALNESIRSKDIALGVAATETAFSMSGAKPLASSDLALQFYQECLLLKNA